MELYILLGSLFVLMFCALALRKLWLGPMYGLLLAKPTFRARDLGNLFRSTARMIAKAALTIFLLDSYAQIIRSDLSALAPPYKAMATSPDYTFAPCWVFLAAS